MKATPYFYFIALAALLLPAAAAGGVCDDLPGLEPADCRDAARVGDVATVVADGQTLIAWPGRYGAGFSVWARSVDGMDPEPLYQDLGHPSREVRVLRHGGVDYAFSAGPGGVFVYDLTQAQALAQPCLDDRGAVCPGVFQGRLGETADATGLDVFEREGVVYVTINTGDGLEVWAISNPAIPGMAIRRYSEPAGPESARGVVSARLDLPSSK